ncbi:hypothetical protein ACERZ8_00720 [Tateyamaria armeniaca]|uniref:DdrB-like domain-containing protein n=1 Tax=Tateyamaria armeniaca TaxID=2518930 RepID=A0ABW8UR32_9RHOB
MSNTEFENAEGTASSDGSDVSVESVNEFLSAFGSELVSEEGGLEGSVTGSVTDDELSMQSAIDDTPSPETLASIARADTAFAQGKWDDLRDEYRSDNATPEARAAMVTKMLTSDDYHDRLRHDPALTAHMLASATVEDLEACGYLDRLSPSKVDVLSDALDFMVRPSFMMRGAKNGYPMIARDPAVFAEIAEKLPQKYWNDTNRGLGAPERGLGPRMCAGLWNSGGFDEICGLIDMGVDTKRAALAQGGDMGTYSGFVMPLQHLIQEHMSDIRKLGTPEEQTWDDQKRAKVRGAQQIFAALETSGTAETLTDWQDVVDSELLDAFKDDPGTIWGFERVRGPFVEAAHDTDKGTQPVRMMEIWEAVKPILSPGDYVELLENPDKKIREVIAEAVKQIDVDFATKDKYAHARGDDGTKKNAYIKAFVTAAQSFLETFAKQIPEGVISRQALTAQGATRPSGEAIELSDLIGIDSGKMMGMIACKAGLWAAKEEGKPVYYVMDGINMQDVVDYKKVQNQTIQEFLANGGATQSSDTFEEVITMQEVREFLTHWDDLKDTVKICVKGDILEGRELDDYIAQHQQAMQQADEDAGRAPAAPLAEFKSELKAIDSNIFATLEKAVRNGADAAVINMDARDIVLKSNYVLRIATAKPSLVLKYLLSKCEVLFQYRLLSPDLVRPAAGLASLLLSGDNAPPEQVTKPIATTLKAEIKKCTKKFRQPLTESLLDLPLLERR